jgi:hypothetical protein
MTLAYDAEHRLVLAVVPGAHSTENAEEIVQEAHDRAYGRKDLLLTSGDSWSIGIQFRLNVRSP